MSVMHKFQGFTLVELMITVAIFAILMAAGMPAFDQWSQNSQIRTTAGAIHDGLTLARAEAVRRNATIRFHLTTSIGDDCAPSASGTSWVVSYDDVNGACGHAMLKEEFSVNDATNNPVPRIIQRRSGQEGSARVSVTATGGNSVFTFNGLGRLTSAADGIDVKPVGVAGNCTGAARCLRVVVSAGGQVRVCVPDGLNATDLPAGDPQKC